MAEIRALGIFLSMVLVAACAADGDTRTADGGTADGAVTDGSGGGDGGRDGSSGDAGPPPDDVTLDGILGDDEWFGAYVARNTVPTDWTGNRLDAIHVLVLGSTLWIGIEGTVEPMNAIVLYVDGNRGGTTGVADLATLSDGEGALDNSISAGIGTPVDFRADFAWGTRAMGRAAMGFDPDVGWRDIATNPADFAWIDAAEAPTVCSTSACETRIALSRIGASSGAWITMFARITNGDGTALANQTLPEDDPTMPAIVFEVLQATVP